MSKTTKEINHDFNIGDVVFMIKDNAIIPCVVIGITVGPIYDEKDSVFDLIDKETIRYTLIKIKKDFDKDSKPIFKVSSYEYDKYNYYCGYVYGSVDELLSDLEKTIEKF